MAVKTAPSVVDEDFERLVELLENGGISSDAFLAQAAVMAVGHDPAQSDGPEESVRTRRIREIAERAKSV